MSSEDGTNVLSDLTKRRGAIRGSITRLGNRLQELEDHPGDPDNVANANIYATKLDSLSNEIRAVHYQVLSFFDEEADLEKQQGVLDNHDEVVSSMILRLNQVVTKDPPRSNSSGSRNSMSLKLKRIRTGLESTERDLSSLGSGEDELSLAEQNQERLTEYKSQLNVLYDKLTGLDIKEDDELLATF